MKKVNISKTLNEIFGKYYRVVFFGQDKRCRVLLLSQKEIKKNKTFNVKNRKYIFDDKYVYWINKIPHIFYMEGVALPFTFEASEQLHPQWDASLLDTTLKLDFGIKLLGQDRTMNMMLVMGIIIAAVFLFMMFKGG